MQILMGERNFLIMLPQRCKDTMGDKWIIPSSKPPDKVDGDVDA
jgi:hypothetical protein